MRNAPVARRVEPLRPHTDANVGLRQVRKYVTAREQLIHPPPKHRIEFKRILGQYPDSLQMWKGWAELQHTLAPPVIHVNEGTNGQ